MRWRFHDRVTRFEPWATIEGAKAVSLEEYSLLEPFGRRGEFPETLVIETAVQLARWLVMASSGFGSSCVLAQVDGFEFTRVMAVGRVMTTSLNVTRRGTADVCLSARVGPPDAAIARGAFVVSHLPLVEVADPSDMQALWQELYVPTPRA